MGWFCRRFQSTLNYKLHRNFKFTFQACAKTVSTHKTNIVHGAIDIWKLNMTRKKIKRAKTQWIFKGLFKPILNENSCKPLGFYTFSFPCVFLKHWSFPPPPTSKEQRKRKTRKWVLGFFNTLSMGWEKDRPKYLGFELCPSSSKARPFAPKLSSKARLLPRN